MQQVNYIAGAGYSDGRASDYQISNLSLIPSRGNFFHAMAEKYATLTFQITLANAIYLINNKSRFYTLQSKQKWNVARNTGKNWSYVGVNIF